MPFLYPVKRTLILVAQPFYLSTADPQAIRQHIIKAAPDIEVLIVGNADNLDLLDNKLWANPTLNVSFGPTNALKPRRGPIFANHAIPKIERYRREPFSFLPDGLSHNVTAVYEAVRSRSPAVLHAWQDTTNLECAFAGVLAGVPKIILHPHNMRPDLIHKAPIIHSLRRSYKALLGRQEVHAVFVSDASRRDYREWLGLQENDHCHLVYNGFEWRKEQRPAARKRRRAQLRRELSIPEHATVIGGVFRFHPVKRPKLWTEVAQAFIKKHQAAVFVIYGDDPELSESKAYAQKLGIANNVRFPGRVTGADEKVTAFDALLHTSETEGLPTVLIEAQVAGVPVFAYSTGGVPECVHPEISKICTKDSPADLEAGLSAILSRRPPPAKLIAAARFVRNRFSRDTMVKHLEAI